jgi:hypothetical protein
MTRSDIYQWPRATIASGQRLEAQLPEYVPGVTGIVVFEVAAGSSPEDRARRFEVEAQVRVTEVEPKKRR